MVTSFPSQRFVDRTGWRALQTHGAAKAVPSAKLKGGEFQHRLIGYIAGQYYRNRRADKSKKYAITKRPSKQAAGRKSNAAARVIIPPRRRLRPPNNGADSRP